MAAKWAKSPPALQGRRASHLLQVVNGALGIAFSQQALDDGEMIAQVMAKLAHLAFLLTQSLVIDFP